MDNLSFGNVIKMGIGTPILVIAMLAMMILPLPPLILDVLFTFNIALSLIVVLATVYNNKPIDFSVFPTVLLLATLLRLALNVASTRVVLLNGHTGTDAAGQVIKSFGEVVIGGNYAVGVVVFAILMLINFVVVTKGAGRVSEVSARFMLDSLPGKQMAIDADLNAGMITQEEAKTRRKEVSEESDFYGSMDGASKFVRGDAIAGVLILFINLIGGLMIGVLQHDMSIEQALHFYALLTIGDGLVAQVPSLLLSTATAITVTRISSAQDMGSEVLKHIIGNPKSMYITASVIFALGIIPGMPHFAFILLAVIISSIGYYTTQSERMISESDSEEQAVEEETSSSEMRNSDVSWNDVRPVDPIGLEVGYKLISLVDKNQDGQLLIKIKGVRKKLSKELGFLVPSVHIHDNLDLAPNVYRITIKGVTISESEIYSDKLLAINPGQVYGPLQGIAAKDPSFGLDSFWVDENQREHAQTQGYTVVDPSTVVATNLSKVLQDNSHELFGHDEAQQLLDRLAETSPKLVEALVPDTIALSTLVNVLQRLLSEHIPISDIRTIAETLSEAGRHNKDSEFLSEAVRGALSRLIIQKINGPDKDLYVIALNPELEQLLQNVFLSSQEDSNHIEPGMAQKISKTLNELVQQQEMAGRAAILVVPPKIRYKVSSFFRKLVSSLYVISYNEIPDDKKVNVVATLG